MEFSIISDNYYFLYGVSELIKREFGFRTKVSISFMSEKNSEIVFFKLKHSNPRYVIICLANNNCLKSLLNNLKKTEAEIFLMTNKNVFSRGDACSSKYSVFILPSTLNNHELINHIKNSERVNKITPCKNDIYIIKKLSEGVSVGELSTNLGLSPKTICNLRDKVMQQAGGLAGIHGLLLLRNIFG